jgi:hypothetical protein
MEVRSFVRKLYGSIGISNCPDLIELADPKEFFNNFELYKGMIRGVLYNPWNYDSVISKPVTFENGGEGRVYSGINPEKKICWDQVKALEKPTPADRLVDAFFDEYDDELSFVQLVSDKTDPSCQLGIDESLFLGNFGWLKTDLDFYLEFGAEKSLTMNEKILMDCFQEVVENKLFLLTLDNLVVISKV